MNARLKLAVFGFGSIGRHHARNLSDMPEVQLAGVVDVSEVARDEAARLGYATFSSIRAAISAGIDAAIVAVPTLKHHEVALAVLSAGIPVLVEKPIASTLDQALEIIEAARRQSLPLMVGYVERFNPAIITAQRLMKAGWVGTPLHVATRRVGGMPIRVTDANVLVDIGVHDIDIMSFLLESKLQLVSAQGGMAVLGDRVDYASLALDAEGIVGHATINWVTPVKVRDLTITGASGYLQVDYLRQQTHFAPGRQFSRTHSYEAVLAQYEEGSLLEIPIDRFEPLRLQLERFVAVLEGKAEAPDPEVSLVSLRIALQATEIIERSARIRVPA